MVSSTWKLECFVGDVNEFYVYVDMHSHAVCTTNNRDLNHIGFLAHPFSRSRKPTSLLSSDCRNINRRSYFGRKDSVGVSSLDDWGDSNGAVEYMFSSSEGEDSDGEIILQPITDVDLPSSKERFLPSDDSITVTAHRLATLARTRKRRKTIYGVMNNVGLMSFSTLLLLLVDQCAWRIVRLPLAPFHLMRPFLISVVLVSCAGYICVPLFRMLKLRSIVRKEEPTQNSCKKGTPMMGGLYFVPIGLLVAEVLLNFSSTEVSGAAAATVVFAAIGLLDDLLSINNCNDGLPGWMRILLEVAAGTWFSYWLYTTDISTPYSIRTVFNHDTLLLMTLMQESDILIVYGSLDSLCIRWKSFRHSHVLVGSVAALSSIVEMAKLSCVLESTTVYCITKGIVCYISHFFDSNVRKMVVPLPAPLGLVCLGKCYPVLSSFCFVSMTNAIDLTDGLDGLAAGTAALAFIGMSIVALPICSDLSIFGASMAGACVGFLFHNRYRASIFMGDTGALALGGALAAMASCTGMFFPLFISSGVFVLEALSVIIQVQAQPPKDDKDKLKEPMRVARA
ncbi:UNVERIFIED_CONTAM: Phospho-N-acetylmuramoyl-pentapeptide-transferase [Sesamum radiatum]|uniref:Phospho-N-acetylmuramoyl-pentapeptide-transferase n=1 Tax=Sesamum radiatum TaxID=300843 RepID=A0AAW2T1M9_SESRA